MVEKTKDLLEVSALKKAEKPQEGSVAVENVQDVELEPIDDSEISKQEDQQEKYELLFKSFFEKLSLCCKDPKKGLLGSYLQKKDNKISLEWAYDITGKSALRGGIFNSIIFEVGNGRIASSCWTTQTLEAMLDAAKDQGWDSIKIGRDTSPKAKRILMELAKEKNITVVDYESGPRLSAT